MLSITYKVCAILLATTMLWLDPAQTQLLDEDEDLFGRPWPTYSLQNMPKTQFTCRDKILGGYYADPETQCQMFHVCVKLPGIGVQDYRFLCPNSTAFDQELQICANWADVDCDKATAYYDNNNLNDLYRGGDESKAAHEEEATFHLQRAESADVRRHKEQQQQQQPKTRSRHNYANANSNANSNLNADSTPASKRPISSYYTPTTSSSSSTTTTSTERSYYNNHNYNNNNNDDSKQDIDDIFKGSHSSHFFANRHGGREFDEEPAQRVRPNDVNDYTRKTTEAVGKTRATPTRAQTTASTTTTTTTAAPTTKALKKITLHAAYNTDFQDFTSHYRSTTPSSVTPTAATTPRLGSGITSRFSFGQSDYQTQERIQPTTYNPNASGFRKSTVSSATKLSGKNAQDFDKETTRRSKTTVITTRKLKLGPQESNYVNHNEFVELPRHKLQQPQPFQAQRKPAQLEPQYQRPKAPAQPLTRVGNQEPTPFKAATSARPRVISNRGSITYKATTQRYVDDEIHYPTTTTSSAVSPSAAVAVKKLSTHAARDAFTPTTFKPTTYKKSYEQSFYQTQQTQRPSQAAVQSISKKTSPVTASLPTTANPYYNVDEDDGQYHPELYENDFPRNRFKFLRNRSSSSTTSSTTSAPVSSRQPHGFQQAHSHLRSQQQSAYQKEQSDLSDEDELFKTAQSLNFGAASINKLRADIYKAEKTSQQYNSQYSPQAAAPSSPKTTSSSSSSSSSSTTTTTIASTTRRPTTSTTTTTTTTTTSSPVEKKTGKSKKEQQKEKKSKSNGKRPAHADEDTSYDYAYYDTD
ncbi:mucin-5AC isoform X2 [Drosophila busckii]|uniref:mucin-5AC isoform X2 n=1 Tax=Drosophila busckii TaxID=30019 RepID=UPI00083F31C8|nr:mucin-5AC isoform X2 [Drosophila busckii]